MSNDRNKKSAGRFIPDAEYRWILRLMPVACADLVVIYRGQFLLGQRINQPAKNQWRFPGGRILKGETFEQAIARKLKEETGVKKFIVKKILGADETMFKKGVYDFPVHTVNIVFLVFNKESPPKLLPGSSDFSQIKWFKKINPRWHPYIKKHLALAGFK